MCVSVGLEGIFLQISKTVKSDFFEQVLCPCEIENTGIRRILQYTHIKRHFSLANTDEKVTLKILPNSRRLSSTVPWMGVGVRDCRTGRDIPTDKENSRILPNISRWTIAVTTERRVRVR